MSEFVTFPFKNELVDVVNASGEPTGRVVDVSKAHQEGLPHRDVHVWVTDGRDLLQQQRGATTKIMPLEWDISVGGHVRAGESYVDAALRETAEELGLRLNKSRLISMGRFASEVAYPGWQYPHNIVGDNFVVVAPDLRIEDLQPEEGGVLNLRWYPINQLEVDLANARTAKRHASQPTELYRLGIEGLRRAIARS